MKALLTGMGGEGLYQKHQAVMDALQVTEHASPS